MYMLDDSGAWSTGFVLIVHEDIIVEGMCSIYLKVCHYRERFFLY